MVAAVSHLLAAIVASSPATPATAAPETRPPDAVPFDCSWIYHPPKGPRERFEGVYFSFIDKVGFVACRTDAACADWMGKKQEEIDFGEAAGARFQKRAGGVYGIFRIVFEGRRGRLADRPGCEPGHWTLNPTPGHYLHIDRVLSVKPLDGKGR